MLPEIFKKIIIQQLRLALKNKKPIALHLGFELFIEKNATNKDQDYLQLLADLQDMIHSNRIYSEKYLGEAYLFFKTLEITPNGILVAIKKAKNNHIDDVDKVYEIFKEQLNNLLSDVVPNTVLSSEQKVNEQINNLHDTLRTMRDLACRHVA